MFVSAIIRRDLEIMLVHSISTGNWMLPSVYIADNADAVHSITEHCKTYNTHVTVTDRAFETEYDGHKYVYFETRLDSFTYALGRKDASWMPLSELCSLTFASPDLTVIQRLIGQYSEAHEINLQLESTISNIASELEIDIVTQSTLSSFRVFVRNEWGGYCPFIFNLDYISDKQSSCVNYYLSWPLTKMYCDGDKTDLYVLFSSLMAVLQKTLFSKTVFIEYLSLFVDYEFNGARLVFKSHDKPLTKDAFFKKVGMLFQHYLSSLLFFDVAIGSFSLKKKDELLCDSILNALKEGHYHNAIAREEHQFYGDFDSLVFGLRIQNDVFSYQKLTSCHKWSVLDGVDGKILFQEGLSGSSYNYVDNEIWNMLSLLITAKKWTKYSLVCQHNCLYVITPHEFWIFHGDFGEYRVNEEKNRIKNRQSHENSFLHFNRRFKWKYPINPARFEELIADLIEVQPDVSSVRLAGNVNNSDGGRDILIYKQRMKGEDGETQFLLSIGQCKAYKNTVNKSHVCDIRDTIEFFGAQGFFLAAASKVSGPLISHLEKIGEKYDVDWWTEREIFKKLRQNSDIADDYRDILEIIEL